MYVSMCVYEGRSNGITCLLATYYEVCSFVLVATLSLCIIIQFFFSFWRVGGGQKSSLHHQSSLFLDDPSHQHYLVKLVVIRFISMFYYILIYKNTKYCTCDISS